MIRQATRADTQVVHTCTRAAFARYSARLGRDPAPMQIDPGPAIARGEVHVVTAAEDGVVGHVICRRDGRDMLLDTLAVWPEHAGRGFGTRLVAHVEALARQQALEAVTLYTNAKMVENLPFYARLGYIRTGRHWQGGFDRIFFRKPLGRA